jgi:ABC-type dipeptide/oligopeptide/nickel transport system ATPase component
VADAERVADGEGVAHIERRRALDDPGCPYRERCVRAQGRCAAEMPPLVPPLGVDHPVACWFPEPVVRHADQEPTARDFAQG